MAQSERSLIVLPDDGLQPVLDLIEGARHSLELKIFAVSHPALMGALVAAHRRGVRVRVMLNPSRRTGYADNAQSSQELAAAGLEVLDTNPSFEVSHEKSFVVDERLAVIQSFNWTEESLRERDFAVVTSHPEEVLGVRACFEADWERRPFEPSDGSSLVWCRGNGRRKFGEFIDATDQSLWIQHERYDDMTILEHLVRASVRGVRIRALVDLAHHFKAKRLLNGVASVRILAAVGAKVRHMKRVHAKVMLADEERALVGSINLSPGSFDDRRELAIEVRDEPILERMRHVLRHDWKHSHRIDLSEAGVIRDLERHERQDLESVALHEELPESKPPGT